MYLYNHMQVASILHWLISGAFGFLGGLAAGAFKWFYPSRKEWRENRRAKRESKIDIMVLAAISNFTLWKGARPITGAGVPGVRGWEIADQLRLNRDVVADSLERLLVQGKVRKEGGTLDDPSPIWHYAPR
jgi:hypothetical protein